MSDVARQHVLGGGRRVVEQAIDDDGLERGALVHVARATEVGNTAEACALGLDLGFLVNDPNLRVGLQRVNTGV